MKFKKLFAGVAAAATLLAGMAFGTGVPPTRPRRQWTLLQQSRSKRPKKSS